MNSKHKLEITLNAEVFEAPDHNDYSLTAFKNWLNEVMLPAISQEPVTENLYIRCLKQEAKFSLS